MENLTNKLTDLALVQAVADNDVRVAMMQPYNHANGNTYATDGRIILCLPTSMCKRYEPKTDAKFPDVEKYMEGMWKNATDVLGTLPVKHLIAIDGDVEVAGSYFGQTVYNKLRDITLLLGIDGWEVRTSNGLLLLCHGIITMVVCNLCESDEHTLITLTNDVITDHIDHESASAYASVIEERMAREKAEAEKAQEAHERMRCIYAFTIVRYATMYVKADSFEEARETAHKYCHLVYDSDFDNPEVDSYDECPSEPDDDMDTIFNTDGDELSYDDVMDELEEENN